MAASSWHSHFFEKEDFLYFGIMGGVNTVPAGTVVDFIVYFSSEGVNQVNSAVNQVNYSTEGQLALQLNVIVSLAVVRTNYKLPLKVTIG